MWVCRVSNQRADRSRSGAGIRSAKQGVVTISDRDQSSPQLKKVRVVTTVEYFLRDWASPGASQRAPWALKARR